MIEIFTTNMPLAEADTIKHFPALLEFVELWNRWIDGSLPVEVLGQLSHSEEKLFPLYDDLAEKFERMQWLLAETAPLVATKEKSTNDHFARPTNSSQSVCGPQRASEAKLSSAGRSRHEAISLIVGFPAAAIARTHGVRCS